MIQVKICLNGTTEAWEQETTLLTLLQSKGVNPDTVVVVLNSEVADRANLAKVVLKENDKVDVLRFVGGG